MTARPYAVRYGAAGALTAFAIFFSIRSVLAFTAWAGAYLINNF